MHDSFNFRFMSRQSNSFIALENEFVSRNMYALIFGCIVFSPFVFIHKMACWRNVWFLRCVGKSRTKSGFGRVNAKHASHAVFLHIKRVKTGEIDSYQPISDLSGFCFFVSGIKRLSVLQILKSFLISLVSSELIHKRLMVFRLFPERLIIKRAIASPSRSLSVAITIVSASSKCFLTILYTCQYGLNCC